MIVLCRRISPLQLCVDSNGAGHSWKECASALPLDAPYAMYRPPVTLDAKRGRSVPQYNIQCYLQVATSEASEGPWFWSEFDLG